MNKRNTWQKNVILKWLQEHSNEHLSIEYIKEKLDEKNENVGKTTIYRMINELIEQGEVIKIPLENEQGFCYKYKEKCSSENEHCHLICENCGKLLHFETNEINEFKKEVLNYKGFNINENKITFYGKCDKCNQEGINNEF